MASRHRSAIEFDWRSRLHVGIGAWGSSVDWGEALRLTQVLARDGSTYTAAAVGEWDYPLSSEGRILADLFDLWTAEGADPYPRPWPDPNTRVVGRGTELTPAEFKGRWAEIVSRFDDRKG